MKFFLFLQKYFWIRNLLIFFSDFTTKLVLNSVQAIKKINRIAKI